MRYLSSETVMEIGQHQQGFQRLTNETKSKSSFECLNEQGSSRSGVLGEVTVNLGEFAASKNAQQRALPLKSCTTGTVLHVRLGNTTTTPKNRAPSYQGLRTCKCYIDL